jgi:hypothetical protein
MGSWLDGAGSSESRYEYPLLKLQEGVTYQVRILDVAPVKRHVHFNSIPKRTVICPGAKCLFCLGGTDVAASQAYVNVLDRMDGTVKVYRFRVGTGFGAELAKLLSAEGDPSKYDIRIVRTGLKKDTRYALARIDGEAPPSAEAIRSRYDLEALLKPMTLTEMEKFAAIGKTPPAVPSSAPTGRIATFEDVKADLNAGGAEASILNPNPEEGLPL